MKLDNSRLNEWLSIATNVAVVAGIVILAIEIRQNSVALRSNVLQSVSTESNPLNLALATDASMRETWVRGLREPSSLSESQRLQLNATLHVWFNNAQNWFYQMRSGVLDYEIADGHWTTMATMYNSFPGFRQYWESRGYSYTPDFQEFVEKEVFTRAPLEYSPDPIGSDFASPTEVEAITEQLDGIYAISTGTGESDATAEHHLRFYAAEPTVMPPEQDPIVGHEAVSEFYRRVYAEVDILENSYSNLTINVQGDLATRRYIGSGSMKVTGESEVQMTVNQMTDILINVQGEWKTLIHSWSPTRTE